MSSHGCHVVSYAARRGRGLGSQYNALRSLLATGCTRPFPSDAMYGLVASHVVTPWLHAGDRLGASWGTLLVRDAVESLPKGGDGLRIGMSILLIALGAIVAFAVNGETQGFGINTIGWILMILGTIGFLVSLAFSSSGARFGGHRRKTFEDGPWGSDQSP
jgi:hypothetical protein